MLELHAGKVNKMRLFLTFFVLMLSNGCAFSAILNGQSEFQIEKGFYAKSESPHYDFQLVLKVDRTGGVLLPASFDDAVEQLRRGIDPRIMNQSVSALTRSCEGNTFCDYSSVDMWDRFIIESENVEIEQGHTLSVYLYQMSEFIGQVWHLDKACSYEKNPLLLFSALCHPSPL